ncbi:hypothetical protein C8R44DRAFT_141699 [Mycena epipterygia]|nr:hypothetical protein C8R44DRAFT_141699 [Mycena epipterygia]
MCSHRLASTYIFAHRRQSVGHRRGRVVAAAHGDIGAIFLSVPHTRPLSPPTHLPTQGRHRALSRRLAFPRRIGCISYQHRYHALLSPPRRHSNGIPQVRVNVIEAPSFRIPRPRCNTIHVLVSSPVIIIGLQIVNLAPAQSPASHVREFNFAAGSSREVRGNPSNSPRGGRPSASSPHALHQPTIATDTPPVWTSSSTLSHQP